MYKISAELLLLFIITVSCNNKDNRHLEFKKEPIILKLATTTSVDNTGLLSALLPPFEGKYNIKVAVIAVGTGKAIKLGENGDVDLILVHAPDAEEKFIMDGCGINRRDLMHNSFIIAGPVDDPAKIRELNNAVMAFRKIAETKTLFISRGDNSGTHIKEKKIWQSAGINPEGSSEWYISCGQGMEAALNIAFEKKAYILTDKGTYLALKDKIDLVILSSDDPKLLNPYSIMAVNPAKHPHIKYIEAMMLIGWTTSVKGQNIIGNFKKNGEILFYPESEGD